MTEPRDRRVRRVVTAADPDARSYVESDTLLPAGQPVTGRARAVLWCTDKAPAVVADPDPTGNGLGGFLPAAGTGGSLAFILDIPSRPEIGAPTGPPPPGVHVTPDRIARHPGFHATDTLDYCVCLEGEVIAVLDKEEVVLRPGDVLIQRGTFHAWENRGHTPARMLFVMIDATPASPQRASA